MVVIPPHGWWQYPTRMVAIPNKVAGPDKDGGNIQQCGDNAQQVVVILNKDGGNTPTWMVAIPNKDGGNTQQGSRTGQGWWQYSTMW
ncbi:hypothetical protein CDAR_111341 [Caerostris darwini]|uniref:Uncharacterized protein n=1 Tax=Caerostris darwini TaxID=1538125 RepID=A0AAV4UC88_9ARAC|nr:hypothetical protein CDAR_111341 [Caerostris darwini]